MDDTKNVRFWQDILNSIQNANITYAHAQTNTDRFKSAWEKVGTTRFSKPGPMNKQYFVIYLFIYFEWLHCTVEIFSANPRTSLREHRNKRKKKRHLCNLSASASWNVLGIQNISNYHIVSHDFSLHRLLKWQRKR